MLGKQVRWFSGRKLYELYPQQPDWFVLNQRLAHQNYVNNSREMEASRSGKSTRLSD